LNEPSEVPDDDQFVDDLGSIEPSILEELVNNAKQPGVWKMKGQKQIYMGFAQSTLRNKRAALRKLHRALTRLQIGFFMTSQIA
ncbi:22164_t:CDS:1, partial [Racocetra persica]